MASRISTAISIALAASCGCVDAPTDRTARYAGHVAPCQAVITGDGPSTSNAPDGPLWLPGPWPTWNTHPAEGCNDNPRIPLGATRRIVAVTGVETTLEYRDLEMYITYPAASDPSVTGVADVSDSRFPVIVFGHANNDRVCEIFQSYYSLHDHWASWGFVVVAVDGTAFNCDVGTKQNIDLRAASMEAAIDTLRLLDADPQSRFFERLDLDRIVLAGHSRGGGAAFVAASNRPEVIGVITLQGIDLTAFGYRASMPTLPTLGMTAGNDVDLHYPRVEPIEDGLHGAYTWVNINGGVHAYTADIVPTEFDDRPGISRQNQHDITELYTTAFLRNLSGEDQSDVLFSLAGGQIARSVSGHGVYQRWRAPSDAIWVDRFDRADPRTNDLGGETVAEGFLRVGEVFTYRPDEQAPAGRWVVPTSLLLSSAGPAVYRSRLDAEGPLDVTATPVLMFRVKGPDFGVPAPLQVAFIVEGGEQVVRIDDAQRGPLPLGNRFQQAVVDIPDPSQPLLAVEFRLNGGSLFIDDVRFTSE